MTAHIAVILFIVIKLNLVQNIYSKTDIVDRIVLFCPLYIYYYCVPIKLDNSCTI